VWIVRLALRRTYTFVVRSGLNDGDPVVVHPGDALPEGAVVDPVALRVPRRNAAWRPAA
jgi:hypothetical protein